MITTWKTVRVFISSTFRDMQAERDWLVRFVFPRLREELLKFRIHLEDVDLRWGVTSDQDAFDLCMEEIDNCHPRFICILGGRYGWVPPPKEIPADFLDSVLAGASAAGSLTPAETNALHALYLQANGGGNYRLTEKLRTNAAFNARGEIAVGVLQRAGLPEAQRSITASEIHYGGLDELQKPTFRFFYFREDRVTNAIPEPAAKDYREPAGSLAAGFLEAIKARIIDPASRGRVLVAPDREEERSLTWHEYSCEWDAATSRIIKLKEFGELVYNDLLASVTAQFGVAPEQKASQTDEEKFDEENAAMEAFVEEGNERFVLGSRKTVLNELLAHASATGGHGYVCLTGAPGSGKSALLAHLSTHSTLNPQPSTLLIRHFVGASPGSTDVRRTLRRLCHELKVGCPDITADISDDPEKLRVAFPDFLRQACTRHRAVILLDAVNQFDPASHSAGLHWLPQELPGNACVILSALDGPALEELRRRRRKPREIELKPLTTADGEAIIEQFRNRYRKKFEPDQRAALLAKTDAGTPLYLLAALEELRTLGTYEQITKRIWRMPGDTESLFKWILKRLQRDKGFRDSLGKRIGRELVSDFAVLLGASRHGLSQRELADLLDTGDPQGNVAALLHLLRPYLMRRGELLDFYHGQFRAAAMEAWLKTDAQHQAAHTQLAGYFRNQADPGQNQRWQGENARPLMELPFHLAGALQWEELAATLSSLRFVVAKANVGLSYDLILNFDEGLTTSQIRDSKRVALVQLRDLVWRQADLMCRFPALVQQQVLLGLGRFANLDPALTAQAIDLTDEARAAGLCYAEVALPEFVAEQVGLTIEGEVDAIASTRRGVLVWLRGGRWFELGSDGAQIAEGQVLRGAPISRLVEGAGSLAAASAQSVLLWPSWPAGAPQTLRHTSAVERIRWSADGSRLLVVGQGGAWWLYGRPQRTGVWTVGASGAGVGRVVEAWIEADGTPAFVTADGRLRRAAGSNDTPLVRGSIACAAWDARRRDIFLVLADGTVSAVTESGIPRWSKRLPALARQLRLAENASGARLLAALNDGSLWTCDTASGFEVRAMKVSQQALADVAAFPSGDWAVARDYVGGIAVIALRPTEAALALRELPARGRIRALHWDTGAETRCRLRAICRRAGIRALHWDTGAETVVGVDETGVRFTVTHHGEEWAAQSLPPVIAPTGDCVFLADGRLVSVEAVLSNNAIHYTNGMEDAHIRSGQVSSPSKSSSH